MQAAHAGSLGCCGVKAGVLLQPMHQVHAGLVASLTASWARCVAQHGSGAAAWVLSFDIAKATWRGKGRFASSTACSSLICMRAACRWGTALEELGRPAQTSWWLHGSSQGGCTCCAPHSSGVGDDHKAVSKTHAQTVMSSSFSCKSLSECVAAALLKGCCGRCSSGMAA